MSHRPSPLAMKAIGWSMLAVAATAGPAQALAAVAVGEALGGHPVGWWCAGLALATALRAAATYGVHVLGARIAARATLQLHHQFGAGMVRVPTPLQGDIATVVGGHLTATRLRGELAGLWLGAAVIVGWLDLRLLAVWLGAGAVVELIARCAVGVREVVCVRRLTTANDQRHQGLVAAAPLLCDLELVPYALEREARAAAPLQRAQAQAAAVVRRPALLAQLVAGGAQSVVAAGAVYGAMHGTGIAPVIAAILATTTAAARCELLATAAHQAISERLAWRRLVRVPQSPAAAMPDPGPAAIALGLGRSVRIEAGTSVAVCGAPARLALVLTALRGAGGMPVMLEARRTVITPAAGLQEWAAQVAIVGAGDRLSAGTIRQNLDPALCYSDETIRAALVRVGFPHAAERLTQELGPGGTGVSAGETLRLAVARAILARPRVLVLNDPTCALDRRTAEAIHRFISEPSRPWTLVVVGADAATAATCEQRIAVPEHEAPAQQQLLSAAADHDTRRG